MQQIHTQKPSKVGAQGMDRNAGPSEASADMLPTHSSEGQRQREADSEERAAKLAELRERKAKLLEAKQRQAKLAVAKKQQDLAEERGFREQAAKEHGANLADGKERGFRGQALEQHAAKLAVAKESEQLAAAKEHEANLADGKERGLDGQALVHHAAKLRVEKLAAAREREVKLQEDNCHEELRERCTDRHIHEGNQEDANSHNQEENLDDYPVLSTDAESQNARQEGVGVHSANSVDQGLDWEGLDFLRCSKNTRAPVERTPEQQEEFERRRQQDQFLAKHQAGSKTKSINRKGHHAFGRQHNRLAT